MERREVEVEGRELGSKCESGMERPDSRTEGEGWGLSQDWPGVGERVVIGVVVPGVERWVVILYSDGEDRVHGREMGVVMGSRIEFVGVVMSARPDR